MSTEAAYSQWHEWQQGDQEQYSPDHKRQRGMSWMPLLVAAGLVALAVLAIWRIQSRRRRHTLGDHLTEGLAAGQELADQAKRQGMARGREAIERVRHGEIGRRMQHRQQRRRGFMRFGRGQNC